MVRTFSGRRRALSVHVPPIQRVADVSERIDDLSDVPDGPARREARDPRRGAPEERRDPRDALEGPCFCVLWCCCGSKVRDPVTRQREFIPE